MSRPRRSELATPASNEHMCEVAARSGADLVFLDLEDACAPAVKESARATAVADVVCAATVPQATSPAPAMFVRIVGVLLVTAAAVIW